MEEKHFLFDYTLKETHKKICEKILLVTQLHRAVEHVLEAGETINMWPAIEQLTRGCIHSLSVCHNNDDASVSVIYSK